MKKKKILNTLSLVITASMLTSGIGAYACAFEVMAAEKEEKTAVTAVTALPTPSVTGKITPSGSLIPTKIVVDKNGKTTLQDSEGNQIYFDSYGNAYLIDKDNKVILVRIPEGTVPAATNKPTDTEDSSEEQIFDSLTAEDKDIASDVSEITDEVPESEAEQAAAEDTADMSEESQNSVGDSSAQGETSDPAASSETAEDALPEESSQTQETSDAAEETDSESDSNLIEAQDTGEEAAEETSATSDEVILSENTDGDISESKRIVQDVSVPGNGDDETAETVVHFIEAEAEDEMMGSAAPGIFVTSAEQQVIVTDNSVNSDVSEMSEEDQPVPESAQLVEILDNGEAVISVNVARADAGPGSVEIIGHTDVTLSPTSTPTAASVQTSTSSVSAQTTNVPKTGDSSQPLLYGIMSGLAACLAGAAAYFRKKASENDK